ncbi:hypothetical protein HW555_001583 [Spodoptera exigua]|uniref:Uncharacterized protein n=1 Tax=Spodoptera exigua TaxID=7107 RepID=A0A835GS24_SPOEX|nr:hypothetical protein HW555_001583 [Spodoptera exigua]
MYTTEIFIVLSCTIAVRLVIARNIVKFNMKKFYPDEQKVHMIDMTGYDRAAHPEPLPTMASKTGFITYSSLHQGVKLRNDVVVYNQTFNYNGTEEGQRILCQALFDCSIAYLALESSEAIPVLLRGGVGYRHFMAIIKAKPYRVLRGNVQAFCRKKDGRRYETGASANGTKKVEHDAATNELGVDARSNPVDQPVAATSNIID